MTRQPPLIYAATLLVLKSCPLLFQTALHSLAFLLSNYSLTCLSGHLPYSSQIKLPGGRGITSLAFSFLYPVPK